MIEVKQNWLACISTTQKPNLKTVSVSELQECELNLLRFCQNESHQKETLSLQKDNPFPKNSTILSSDSIFADKLLGGRLKLTEFSLKCHSQVIVKKNHPLAALIIKYHHEINLLSGREQTLSTISKKYWIKCCGLMQRVLKHLASDPKVLSELVYFSCLILPDCLKKYRCWTLNLTLFWRTFALYLI